MELPGRRGQEVGPVSLEGPQRRLDARRGAHRPQQLLVARTCLVRLEVHHRHPAEPAGVLQVRGQLERGQRVPQEGRRDLDTGRVADRSRLVPPTLAGHEMEVPLPVPRRPGRHGVAWPPAPGPSPLRRRSLSAPGRKSCRAKRPARVWSSPRRRSRPTLRCGRAVARGIRGARLALSGPSVRRPIMGPPPWSPTPGVGPPRPGAPTPGTWGSISAPVLAWRASWEGSSSSRSASTCSAYGVVPERHSVGKKYS
ncbi:unnamed protein product [Ixodes persulcatus]